MLPLDFPSLRRHKIFTSDPYSMTISRYIPSTCLQEECLPSTLVASQHTGIRAKTLSGCGNSDNECGVGVNLVDASFITILLKGVSGRIFKDVCDLPSGAQGQ
jgi:hypothetical protein